MKDKIFFPIAALVAIIMIYASINIGAHKKPHAIDAKQIGEVLIISPKDLNNGFWADGFAFTRAEKVPGGGAGPHMIALKKFDEKPAIVYQFGASTIAKTPNKSVKIVILCQPMSHQEAKEIAIGLKSGDKIIWQNAKMPPKITPIIINFPASPTPIDAIVINPATEGEEHGIELQALAMKLG